MVDALVAVAPGVATIIAMMTLTLNLWLAAKITTTSGRLNRPWPDLRTTTLPRVLLGALAVAFCLTVVLAFGGGVLFLWWLLAAASGYAAVFPDYLNQRSLGGPSTEVSPYLLMEPTAIASLDALRAAQTFLSTKKSVTATSDVYVWGHSQGAQAAEFVSALQPLYAPELTLKAVAPISPVAASDRRTPSALDLARPGSAPMATPASPSAGAPGPNAGRAGPAASPSPAPAPAPPARAARAPRRRAQD